VITNSRSTPVALLAVCLAFAIPLTGEQPSFDVASVKAVQATADLYRANLGTVLHGEVELTNATLADCLKFAYGYSNDVQLEGPDWIQNKGIRFNIQAKAPPETPRDQILLMLQKLLSERFQLALRKEQKTKSYMALVVGKKPKMQPTPADGPPVQANNGPGHIISQKMTMTVVALLLSRFLREPVLDMTGLQGPYAVHLEWSPEPLGTPSAESTAAPVGPSVFTAVQEQLGLKLEARKGPLEVLVVDRAEKIPLPN
jgi:uncharacterized protein (TIGR03435 family)